VKGASIGTADMKRVLGLDIGGANLKKAHTDGTAASMPFELWKKPQKLPAVLRALVAKAAPFDEIAVTMTGELCDCFETKHQGVVAILDSLRQLAVRKPIRVWQSDGQFVDLDSAVATTHQVAAANWLALATYAGRLVPTGPAVLIDIGSTTTDLVPLNGGKPVPQARTDPQRLQSRELVYTGVRRTPVFAVMRQPHWHPSLAAEWFATMLDVYLLCGDLPENPSDCNTADGRPATKPFAHARLARLQCSDREELPLGETKRLAKQAAQAQIKEVLDALFQVAWQLGEYPAAFVLSGSGEFLARRVANRYDRVARVDGKGMTPYWYRCRPTKVPPGKPRPRHIRLSARLGAECSSAACAYAVAVLAAERNQDA
jgi:probable H4MPT-linked C1 transfer pathway protein